MNLRTLLFPLVLLTSFTVQANQEVATEPPIAKAPNKSEAVDKENSEILQRHYPFYFGYGKKTFKIQVSFKTPIVRNVPLYFGYTQLMFYKFGPHTKSFRDVTYNPELFYRLSFDHQGLFKSIDFGGFDHNSNGKPGDDHRSYNTTYVRGNFEKQSSRWITRAGIQAQYLYSFETGNRDIQDYIGPLAFNISFIQLFESWVDKSEISLQATPGGKFADHWDHGGYQLSWSFRLGGIHLVPAFYLQYYNGFAETLLNYNHRTNDLRAGLIF